MAKTKTPKTNPENTIISVMVTLRGSKPPIWRQLLLPGAMTLGDLHYAIQAAMGWEDCHLHAFKVGSKQYGDPGYVDGVVDEDLQTLNGLLKSRVVRFTYTYDFGDEWEHIVAFEKREPATDGATYPICVAGKRNCPPEDSGGIWSYEEVAAILADPAHPRRAAQIEWIGGAFDPDEFDLARINARLAARF